MLLPTDQQGVVSMFLRPSEIPAEWQEEGPQLVLNSWISTFAFLAPSPVLASPRGCLGCISVLRWQASREKPQA